MPDVWLPGAHIDRGRNAGYNSGRSHMVRAVAHYTVGSDSRNVGRDGYFHWLVHRDASREGGCTQYAEIDAITWHAADAGNPYGPGIEWERNVIGGVNAEGLSDAEPLTDNQLEWGARHHRLLRRVGHHRRALRRSALRRGRVAGLGEPPGDRQLS